MKGSRIVLFLALLLSSALAFAAPVNVNTAGPEAIAASMNGIGSKKAEAIVAYREAHGPFKRVEDLAQVKGIGTATIEKNRDNIRLQDEE